MGFDLYGIKATSKKGEYFRNNIWWWRPLQYFIVSSCSDFLTDNDIEGLGYNNGHKIGVRKTKKIITRLEEVLGNTDKFDSLLREVKNNLSPDMYPTKTDEVKENVKDFVDFLKASGGFGIY
jgi:hypothetical protein